MNFFFLATEDAESLQVTMEADEMMIVWNRHSDEQRGRVELRNK